MVWAFIIAIILGIGVALGSSKLEALNDTINKLLVDGETYTFYINPTFPISNGLCKGISKIEYKGNTIYKHTETGNIIFGALMVLVGLLVIIFVNKGDGKIGKTA